MNPDIWPVVSLKSLSESVQYGFTASASADADGPKFLRITDIAPDSLDWMTVPRCAISARDLQKFVLADGDIVVARTGATVGYAKQVKSPPMAVFASYLVRFRIRRDVCAGFVGSIVQSLAFKEWVRSQAGGSAQPNANAQTLGAFPVAVPPLDIQRRIASILGAYDDLIEVNRRRVALLEGMARGLFEEWFVRFRFPGHEAVPIVDTPDGPLPEGWTVQPLGHVADVNATSIRPATAPQEIGYIDIASVSPGQIDAVNWMPFEDAPGRARRVVRDGSIIWSNVRPNRRSVALVVDPAPGTIASTGFTVLDATAVSFAYLYQWVTTDRFVGYLVGNAGGAAYPAVTATTFERAEVTVPTEALIEQFTALATPMLRHAAVLRESTKCLAASRDLLLPRLISGQLSVTAAERELEDAA